MQDLATEFSKKISGGYTPDPYSGRGDPPHPTPSSAFGTQTLVPLNFSAVGAPLVAAAAGLR